MSADTMETFKVQAQGNGMPTKVDVLGTKWHLQIDEPVEDGGSNSGPNPMHYFTTALAGCQNEQVHTVAGELSLSIPQVDFSIEVDLDLSGFMGIADSSAGSYQEVRLNAVVHGELSQDQVTELGKKVDARCPILSLLRSSGCKIVSDWNKK